MFCHLNYACSQMLVVLVLFGCLKDCFIVSSVVSVIPQRSTITHARGAPCGLRGCKNTPAPFPGRLLYKATKPGLVLFYILACFNYIVA